MKPYIFFKIGSPTSVPHFEIEHFANDLDASDYARVVVLTDQYTAIEVMNGAGSFVVVRDAIAPLAL